MKIGDIAGKTGVATRMLRYYEEQELLTPQRAENGYRRYAGADVERVMMIRDLSAAGVPTRFIKIVLDREYGAIDWTDRCDVILAAMVRDQIAILNGKIDHLTVSRTSLQRLLQDAQE